MVKEVLKEMERRMKTSLEAIGREIAPAGASTGSSRCSGGERSTQRSIISPRFAREKGFVR